MNIKTIVIILILLVPISYSLKKLIDLFKNNEKGCDCSSCPSKTKDKCSTKK